MRRALRMLAILTTVMPSAAPASTRDATGGEVVWESTSPDDTWLARVSETRAPLEIEARRGARRMAKSKLT